MWDLIVSVPDHCLSFYFTVLNSLFSYFIVDGGWGAWGSWQHCSATCGEGLEERVRQCDSPPPVHRGAYCEGDGVERRRCKLQECPGICYR